MPNSSPPCGICSFVRGLVEGQQRETLISILENSEISSEKAQPQLAENGLKVSASTIRRHRREVNISWDAIQEEAPQPPVHKAVEPAPVVEKLPPGWEPFAEYAGAIGKAGVRLPRPYSTERDLLIASGFDPDEWQIAGSINTRKWMRYDGEWLYYYKFDVKAGESPQIIEQHIDELVGQIRKKIESPAFIKPGTDAWGYIASDWQTGKREGNDGTPQTIERVLTSIEMAVERVKNLRRQGFKMPTLLFAGTGDLGEGTCGFYPGQQFLIDRNRRDQGRINRELITKALDELTPLFDKTVVAAVGGNHGENRSPEGQRLTSDGDNDDCAYFDAVREAFDRSGRTDIEWKIMEDELSMALDIGGVFTGLTHGHLFGKGATAQQKALEWWKGQDFGFQPIRGTRILISSHFHHFSAVTHGSRTHLQTSAMDPGSKWVRQSWGDDTPPGVLTLRFDGESVLGWEDLSILHPGRSKEL